MLHDPCEWVHVKMHIQLLLQRSSFAEVPGAPITKVERQEWKTYRQALRNIPVDQASIEPKDVIWPDPPMDPAEIELRATNPDPDRTELKTNPFLQQLIGKTPQEAMAAAETYVGTDPIKLRQLVIYLVGLAAYNINQIAD